MKKTPYHLSGFTLIELLVTISIIAVLFGVVITAAAAASRNSRDAQRKADLSTIQTALQHYYIDQNYFPATNHLSDVVPSYLTSLPTDPTQNSTLPYCYTASPSGCDNTSGNYCKSYTLNASLENSTSNSYTCNSITYNYQVSPLQ